MPDPDPEVATIRARLDNLEPRVEDLTNAVRGTWASTGVVERVATLEAKYSEIKDSLSAIRIQQENLAREQKDRDNQRDYKQQRRDKRIGIAMAAGLTLIVTVLASLIITFLSSGGSAVIQ